MNEWMNEWTSEIVNGWMNELGIQHRKYTAYITKDNSKEINHFNTMELSQKTVEWPDIIVIYCLMIILT